MKLVVTYIIGFIVLGFAIVKIVGPIIPTVKSLLGIDVQGGAQDLPKVPEELFRENFITAYHYCGIGETKEYCRCPIPMSNMGGKKVYLGEQGIGVTVFGTFTSEEEYPEVDAKGNLPSEVSGTFPPERFGPLCVHFHNALLVGDTFGPPAPDYLGVVLFKTEDGKLAWQTNAVDNDYQEFNAEPSVFWRKSDGKRCFWGPWVDSNLFSADTLENPIPDCATDSAAIAATVEQFDALAELVEQCGARSPGEIPIRCGAVAINVAAGLELQQRLAEPIQRSTPPRAKILRLWHPGTREVIAEREYPALCRMGKTNDASTWLWNTQPVPSGEIQVFSTAEGVCFGDAFAEVSSTGGAV